MIIGSQATASTQAEFVPPTLVSALAAFKAGKVINPWKEGPTKKVVGSLSKVPAVYQQLVPHISASDILCDTEQLETLVNPYLKSRTVPENCRFKSFKAFEVWVSNVRRFFNLANGQRDFKKSLKARKDGWASLLQAIAVADDGKPILSGKKMVPVSSFVGLCRENDIEPTDLTREACIELIEKTPTKRAGTIKTAASLLDGLRESGLLASKLLPPELIGDLSGIMAEGQWKTPPLHEEFAKEVDRYIQKRREGTKKARLGTTPFEIETRDGIVKSTADGDRTALAWYHHGLLAAGLVDMVKPFPWDLVSDAALLKTIVDLDVQGAMHRQMTGKERGRRVKSVVRFLDTICQGYAASIDKGFYGYIALNNPKNHTTDKAVWKKKTTLEFVESPALQQIFYGMPQRFYAEAKNLIDRWEDIARDDNKPGLSNLQGRALDLAIVSAHLTITTRFPVRQATSRKLRIGGRNPHVIFPNGGKDVRIYPDSSIIKNAHHFPDGVPLLRSKTFDPTSFLRWYVEKAHPLLLKHRVSAQNRAPERLLFGIGRDELRRKIQKLSTEAGFRIDGHMTRHLAGSILYARGVAIDDIAELLGITVANLVKKYIYINRKKQVQRTIDDMALLIRGLGI